jgi:5'-methylthioadenosine phosphorylase
MDIKMNDVKIGIIGGSGLYDIDGMTKIHDYFPETPWGKPSDTITVAEYKGKKLAFLPRHGRGHFLTPTEVPSAANICALKMLGVEEIVAFSAVGSLRQEIEPRDFVIPNQIIDRTKGDRLFTYFGNGVVAHVTFGDPFSKNLATRIEIAAKSIQLKTHTNKTLVCMEGPIFSTRAESNLYRSWRADIINMSVLPEAKLAREAEIAYQMVCMATDYDSWLEHEVPVTVDMVIGHLTANSGNAKKLLEALVPSLGNGDDLSLKGSTTASIITAPEKRNNEQMKKLKVLFPEL